MGLFDPMFKNQAAISGLGLGLLANAQAGPQRNLAQDILWGVKSGLSLKEAQEQAEAKKRKEERDEKLFGMKMAQSSGQMNQQALQNQRQSQADKLAQDKRLASRDYASSFDRKSAQFGPMGLLAGASPDEVGQYRTKMGLLAGISPKDLGLTGQAPKTPTSLLEYQAAQQDPAFGDFLKDKRQTTLVKENQPLSLSDLSKLQLPSGEDLPLGTTAAQAGAMGATLKKKPIAADSAGKQAMIKTAKEQINIVEGLVFPSGISGEVNNDVVTGMAIKTQTPGILQPLTSGVSKKGQQAAAAMETGIQAITRLETGAAMAPNEINNTRKRFQPMPWDDDTVKRQKFTAYKLFIDNSEKYFDPSVLKSKGQSAAVNDAINKALSEASKANGKSQKPEMLKSRPPLSSFER